MANDAFDLTEHFRLESIHKEIAVVQTTIISNLPDLQKRPELVGDLIRRCDELRLELDRLQTDVGAARPRSSDGNPVPSSNGAGLKA